MSAFSASPLDATKPLQSSSTSSSMGAAQSRDPVINVLNDAAGTVMKGVASAVSDEPLLPIDEEIIKDHNELKSFHAKYKETGDLKWYHQFLWELARHSVAEELVLYPALDKIDHAARDRCISEHHHAKEQALALEKMQRPSAEFDAALDALFKDVLDHATTEENSDLQKLKQHVSREDRIKLNTVFAFRKKLVPTRPHTAIPETPALLNEALGLMVAPIDKFRDLFRDFPSNPSNT